MIDGKFDVVFRGQTIKSIELAQVKLNLANLFKSSPEAVEKLFIGGEVTVKKSLDYATAMKYQSALKKAGALALIKEIESTESSTDVPKKEPTAAYSGKATFGESSSSERQTSENSPKSEESAAIASHGGVEENSASESKDNAEGEMSLAAAGAQIMPDKVYEKRDVDTSDMSLAAAGERILPKKPPEHHQVPSIDHLSLEE